jgi:hypothetical protein
MITPLLRIAIQEYTNRFTKQRNPTGGDPGNQKQGNYLVLKVQLGTEKDEQ